MVQIVTMVMEPLETGWSLNHHLMEVRLIIATTPTTLLQDAIQLTRGGFQ